MPQRAGKAPGDAQFRLVSPFQMVANLRRGRLLPGSIQAHLLVATEASAGVQRSHGSQKQRWEEYGQPPRQARDRLARAGLLFCSQHSLRSAPRQPFLLTSQSQCAVFPRVFLGKRETVSPLPPHGDKKTTWRELSFQDKPPRRAFQACPPYLSASEQLT